MAIKEFIPGRAYRYIGMPVSKDVLSDVPALSGATVTCRKAVGRSASFDCDISPELMSEYNFEEWEEVKAEATKEEGFYLANAWVPAPEEHKEGEYKVYNCGAMGLSIKGAGLQVKIGDVLGRKMIKAPKAAQGVSGALLLEATETALYESLKEGTISVQDILAMTTLWLTKMIVDHVQERDKVSELASLLAEALKED